jgi:hypothetical protein
VPLVRPGWAVVDRTLVRIFLLLTDVTDGVSFWLTVTVTLMATVT